MIMYGTKQVPIKSPESSHGPKREPKPNVSEVCNQKQLVGHVVGSGNILLRISYHARCFFFFQISFLVLHILLCDLDGLVMSEMPLKEVTTFMP